MKKICVILLIIIAACKQQKQAPELTTLQISQVLTQMTEVMIHDITNPPLAARFFSYALLAGYEVMSQHDSSLRACTRY